MPDPDQLPALISLLDDDTPAVVQAVTQALLAFGLPLRNILAERNFSLTGAHKARLAHILEPLNRQWLKANWSSWFYIKNDLDKIEKALGLLAEFQEGLPLAISVKELLDQLAKDFAATNIKKDAYGVAYYLFEVLGLKGAKTDYYNPSNSNLAYVLKRKQGIPISLVCVYMLTARRLGLEVVGCSFPGHFLARIDLNGRKVFVDCFNGGKIMSENDLKELAKSNQESWQEVIHEVPSAETIMSRVLANLIQAYEQEGSADNSHLMFELLNQLQFETLPVKSLK